MTTSFTPRVSSRFLPLACAFTLFFMGKCAQAQVRTEPLRRFLLLGNRKKYESMQRHVFRTGKAGLYDLFGQTDDVREENSNAYVMANSLPGLIPLYHLHHATSPSKEFYTTSESGAKEAVAKSGYKPSSAVIGYISPVQTGDTIPLYQLYRSVKPKAKAGEVGSFDDHFYTTSDTEKQDAIKNGGYIYIKIGGYVWPGQVEYTPGGAPANSAYRSPQYQQAAKMIASVHELYFGPLPVDPKRLDTLIGKLWKMSPEMRQAYSEGLGVLEAGKFCRQLIQTDGDERGLVINQAIMEVYGRPVLDFFGDTTGWNEPLKTGKATYLTILAAETKKLNSDPTKRRDMIDRAYIRSMGRTATDRLVLGKGMQGEQTYWGPRTERFTEIVKANRNWLYSSNGEGDLKETVARALKVKLNRIPTDKEVLFSVKKFTYDRVEFPDMIAPTSYPYYESQVLSAKPESGIKIVGGNGNKGGTRPVPLPKP